jgi:superfamily II DNA helicase RecQ
VDYKATGTLQRSLDQVGRISRNDWEALLQAMVQAGLIAIEEAEFEKDGEVKRYRKVRITAAGLEVRPTTPLELLLSDGVVEAFSGQSSSRSKKTKPRVGASKSGAKSEEVTLTAEGEALAARIRAWRAAQAKSLGVPAYLILHDRTVSDLAQTRPANPRELLEINGLGPAKVERFGEALLDLCTVAK